MSNEAAAAHIRLIMCSRADLQAVRRLLVMQQFSREQTQDASEQCVPVTERREGTEALLCRMPLDVGRLVEDTVEVH